MSLVASTPVSMLLSALILFVAGLVLAFSRRYMDGDRNIVPFYRRLVLLTLSALGVVLTNNVAVLAIAWLAMGYFLSRLIGHVDTWPQAKKAQKFALAHFLIGGGGLIIALTLIVNVSGQWQLSQAIDIFIARANTPQQWIVAGLIGMAAIIQSANLPFHKWLTSSLTAPTPVSAFMHAGIVNAGGILIIRFHDIFSMMPSALMVLFVIGAITAIIGNAWMMVQTNIKAQLANSTVAQMGFMIMQCGLGLYTAALAHLILHGLYKAYYFLNAGSAVMKKHPPIGTSDRSFARKLSIGSGSVIVAGLTAMVFAYLTGKSILSPDSGAILVMIAALAGGQLCLTLMRRSGMAGFVMSLFLGGVGVGLYGLCFNAITAIIPINFATEISTVHLIVMGVFVIGWAVQIFGRPDQFKRLYMRLLNSGQAAQHTIVKNRGEYHAG